MKTDREPTGADHAVSVPIPSSARSGPISHAIFRVARLHRMIASNLLRSVGLHLGQELVMMHLWHSGPQRQADLVRVLDSDAATMTRTIQRLEHAGFVRRVASPSDKRAHLIEPTPASLALRSQVEHIWTELEDAAVGGLDDDERTDIMEALRVLEDHLDQAAAGLTS